MIFLLIALSSIGQKLSDLRTAKLSPAIQAIRQGVSPVKVETKALAIIPRATCEFNNPNLIPLTYSLESAAAPNGPWVREIIAECWPGWTTNTVYTTNGARFYRVGWVMP